jgi:hypothetical protein
MTERWLPVVGWEGLYEVSDLGRVKSLERVIRKAPGRWGKPTSQTIPARILSLDLHQKHPRIALFRNGTGERCRVHRLVLEAFVGPCPPGREACHWNDIGHDNRLTNLRWDTPSANMFDRVRNGIHPQASKTHCKHGHELTAYSRGNGAVRRVCQECSRGSKRRRRAELRRQGIRPT